MPEYVDGLRDDDLPEFHPTDREMQALGRVLAAMQRHRGRVRDIEAVRREAVERAAEEGLIVRVHAFVPAGQVDATGLTLVAVGRIGGADWEQQRRDVIKNILDLPEGAGYITANGEWRSN